MWKHDSPDYPSTTYQPHQPVRTQENRWKYCPSCGTTLGNDHLFCTNCGLQTEKIAYLTQEGGWCNKCQQRLPADYKFCHICGSPSDKSMFDKLHCPKCRAILPQNAKFCVGCRKEVIPSESNCRSNTDSTSS